ncbi:MAG: DNA starvation/stationary phase protection protein Dps [Gemmatimonadaceae bacterium]|jgi:starvation-inducible DNA-binding protein|nr:DNA starvation/stationary phase protection protein Dps [Gemmatimonadaceae bacterium]
MTPTVTAAAPPFHTRNDLAADTRAAMIVLLNERLADAIDLGLQAKQAHWNVKGPHFKPLHDLFDATNALALEWADELAERAVQLGGVAEGLVGAVRDRSRLPAFPTSAPHARAWTEAVAAAVEFTANALRADIEDATAAGDAVTADILTSIAGAADKQLWFVEAHLEGL